VNVLNQEVEIAVLVTVLTEEGRSVTNATGSVILHVSAKKSPNDATDVMGRGILPRIAPKAPMSHLVTTVTNLAILRAAVQMEEVQLQDKLVTIVTREDICPEIVQKAQRRVTYVVNQAT